MRRHSGRVSGVPLRFRGRDARAIQGTNPPLPPSGGVGTNRNSESCWGFPVCALCFTAAALWTVRFAGKLFDFSGFSLWLDWENADARFKLVRFGA